MFSEGLGEELQKLMLHTPKNRSLKEYMDKAIELSDDLYQIQLHGRNRRNAAHGDAPNHPRAAQREASPEAMDWEPSKINRAREIRTRSRRSSPNCYSCGELGHITRSYPNTIRVKRARGICTGEGQKLQKKAEEPTESDSEKEEL
ncbi:hypothetical protein IG631_23139 [Alternaria alternata]|nr:hypothetical protein IG631_23139 [Alternaria alternata]